MPNPVLVTQRESDCSWCSPCRRLLGPYSVDADAPGCAVGTDDHLNLDAAVTGRVAKRIPLFRERRNGDAESYHLQGRLIRVEPRHFIVGRVCFRCDRVCWFGAAT